MPITIQEIIASDTISQLVDKTNFNFDQLLLNGGGPPGPIGPAGPTGPAGGRGPKGTTWYEDTSVASPGVSPNVTPPTATPLEGDYYLQFNGQVWEYNGTTWVVTTVDLQGPEGPAGQDGGFGSYFGQTPVYLSGRNTLTATPVGGPPINSANQSNQGIPTIMIGAVAPNAAQVPGIVRTSAYEITLDLAETIASDEVSMIVHQKNAAATAIRFMGGGADPTENYSQEPLTEFSSLTVVPDDGLRFDIPKAATNPSGNPAITGFFITSPARGLAAQMGGQILLESGNNSNAYNTFAGENGNFQITVGSEAGGGGNGNQFQMVTQGLTGTTRIISGNNVTVPGTSTQAGRMLLDARYIDLLTASDIRLTSGGAQLLDANGNIDIFAGPASFLQMNGNGVQVGYDQGGALTASIALGTTNIGNVSGIKIEAGKPAATSLSNPGITLKTYGAAENIDILANDPDTGGGINIISGNSFSGTGFIKLESYNDSIFTNSIIANTEMSTNSAERLKLYYSSGNIRLGGGTYSGTTAGGNFRDLVTIASSSATFAGIGVNPTNTVLRVGVQPEAPVTSGLNKFYGGGEIIGPYSPSLLMGVADAMSIEGEGALHIRGGLSAAGRQPGAVWMYSSPRTIAQGSGYINQGSIRIWSKAKQRPYNDNSPEGVTIGLNAIEATADFPNNINGAQVSGMTFMYGEGTNQGVGQSFQNDVPENGGSSEPNEYGSINIGDAYRARQTFKVWGDYTGDYYVSVFGGAASGPTVENQSFMSGGQTFGNFELNAGNGGWDGGAPYNVDGMGFRYKYQWQRTGRVVTVSGICNFSTEFQGQNRIANGDDVIVFDTSDANARVQIGPIPFPVQVSSWGSTTDNTTSSVSDVPSGTLKGVDNDMISGTAIGCIDYTNTGTLVVDYLRYTSDAVEGTMSYTPTFGDVRGGSATSPSSITSTTLDTHMWINMYMNHNNVVNINGTNRFGMIPAYIKFQATYELNP